MNDCVVGIKPLSHSCMNEWMNERSKRGKNRFIGWLVSGLMVFLVYGFNNGITASSIAAAASKSVTQKT